MKRITSIPAQAAGVKFPAILLAAIASALFFGPATAPAFAQKAQILVNRSEQDGCQTVCADYILCRGDSPGKNQIAVALTCTRSPQGERTYEMNVHVNHALTFEIAYDSAMLVHTTGDDVIQLRNANVKMRHRDSAVARDSKVVSARYPLTEEQLDAIASAGVSKVLIQTTEGYISTDYKKDKISAAVNAQLSLILSVLDTSVPDDPALSLIP